MTATWNPAGVAVPPLADTALGRTVATAAPDIWNDSCSLDLDGPSIDDFDAFPPRARTLRACIASYHDPLHRVTDVTMTNPDVRPT